MAMNILIAEVKINVVIGFLFLKSIIGSDLHKDPATIC